MNQQASKTSGDLFTFLRKTNEAFAVRHGIAAERQFSDEELAPCQQGLDEAERELYGMTPAERLGELSADEQSALNDLNAQTLIPFSVRVVAPNVFETINVLAPDAISANLQVVAMLFGDFDTVKPPRFKITVEPIKAAELRRAA